MKKYYPPFGKIQVSFFYKMKSLFDSKVSDVTIKLFLHL